MDMTNNKHKKQIKYDNQTIRMCKNPISEDAKWYKRKELSYIMTSIRGSDRAM